MSDSAVTMMVTKIPGSFRSADLRMFFHDAIEAGAFLVFHFRHRPAPVDDAEVALQEQGAAPVAAGNESGKRHCCCVIKVHGEIHAARLIEQYHSVAWHDRVGHEPGGVASVGTVDTDTMAEVLGGLPSGATELQIAELRPPSGLPNGNVGTPISVSVLLLIAEREHLRNHYVSIHDGWPMIRHSPVSDLRSRFAGPPEPHHRVQITPVGGWQAWDSIQITKKKAIQPDEARLRHWFCRCRAS